MPMNITFEGTKKQIFEKSIELFSEKSFETVSLKDIGQSIGKQQSGIYNHFSTKQEILDTIYYFFVYHFFDARLSMEEVDPIIRTGDLFKIIDAITFRFSAENDKIMTEIFRIVQKRKYHDERAKEIVKDMINNKGIAYGVAVFNRAIEQGHVPPFDTRYLSVLCNYCRQSTYARWVLNPTEEAYQNLLKDEKLIYENAIQGILACSTSYGTSFATP